MQRPSRPDLSKEASENVVEYQQKMRGLLDRLHENAEKAFRTNWWISVITVGVGLVFLGNSIALGWLQQSSLSALFGGLTVANFVAYFLRGPQKTITKALGDFHQIQMISRTFEGELANIELYEGGLEWVETSPAVFAYGKSVKLEQVKQLNEERERVLSNSLQVIEKYLAEVKQEEPKR